MADEDDLIDEDEDEELNWMVIITAAVVLLVLRLVLLHPGDIRRRTEQTTGVCRPGVPGRRKSLCRYARYDHQPPGQPGQILPHH